MYSSGKIVYTLRKGEVVLCALTYKHPMKAYWGSGGIVSRILSFRLNSLLSGRICAQFVTPTSQIGGCIQKFPDWPPGVRTASGTALCHQVQLYRYFVSQSSEFYRNNPLCCFSTSVYLL
jgi:hypothetical protein